MFKIPSGGQGKAFVQEMASQFQSYADASAREKVALKAALVLPALVLQRPSKPPNQRITSSIWRGDTVCGNKVTSKPCLKKGGQFKEGSNPT